MARRPQQDTQLKGKKRPDGTLLVKTGASTALMADVRDGDNGTYLDVRLWVKTKKAGGWIYTPKGLCIHEDDAMAMVYRLTEFVQKNGMWKGSKK